jgi:hypothetical protein
MVPGAAVPLKVGVVSDVMLSVLKAPVSLDAARSGVDGAAGTFVSIVTVRPPDAAEGPLPAASVWIAVNDHGPAVSVVLVIVHPPLPFATAVPRETAPVNSSTVAFASDVPLKVGVLSAV